MGRLVLKNISKEKGAPCSFSLLPFLTFFEFLDLIQPRFVEKSAAIRAEQPRFVFSVKIHRILTCFADTRPRSSRDLRNQLRTVEIATNCAIQPRGGSKHANGARQEDDREEELKVR